MKEQHELRLREEKGWAHSGNCRSQRMVGVRWAEAFSCQQAGAMEGFKQGNDFVFYKDPSGLGRTEDGGREAASVAPTARVEVTLGCLEQGWEAGNVLMPGPESWSRAREIPAV